MNPWEHVERPRDALPVVDDSGPVRYERGSRIYASDGPVGTLRQVVVDEDRGEVTILVVNPADGSEPVMIPVDLVEGSAGQAIFLRVTQEQFALGAGRSPRYERRQFARANLKRLSRTIGDAFRTDRLRAISRVERDVVVTGSRGEHDATPAAPGENERSRIMQRVARPGQGPAAVASSGAD